MATSKTSMGLGHDPRVTLFGISVDAIFFDDALPRKWRSGSTETLFALKASVMKKGANNANYQVPVKTADELAKP
ncbi:MAG: hypothetical protein AAFU49_23260, partial [Pseudomonadota bacterium]